MQWEKVDADLERHRKELHEFALKASAASRDVALAAEMARSSAIDNGLFPVRDENGEFVYTAQQGLKAACLAREDAAATLIVQQSVLTRLDSILAGLRTIRSLVYVCVAVLAYVAYRVS
jgi:hypothetical protein